MDITATHWPRLSALLDEAFDLDAGARAAWLARQARTHPDLAPALHRLLAAHATSETTDLLARLPTLDGHPPAPADHDTLRPGARIGPYRLLRELGSGGMADVWLAERADGAFSRDVALKLPRLSRLRRDLALRFVRERDILARLEHPHIARLYDAGVDGDGLPWLAMEFVDGQAIGAHCDRLRLDLRARLALFAQVLEAVQYAHAHLVIHRDLKPSNILVSADGRVRLLDFGIAKLLADDEQAHETQLTELSGRALTPDYASPEQIQGRPLTIASDIYSLGVVLFELLAGRRPYRLKLDSVAQLEQAIVSVDPPRPSSVVDAAAAEARRSSAPRLARALAGDLDTVVLKALARSPTGRYATIAAFAQDLERHLAGEPVLARAPSWIDRARRFGVRHRLAVTAAATVTVALLAAATVSLRQAQHAREQAARAEEVKQFVVDIFRGADPGAGSDRRTTGVELLRQARRRLDAAPLRDEAVRVELLTTIGSGLSGLGETALAETVLAEAAQRAAALDDGHPVAATARAQYGQVLLESREPGRAAPLLETAERVFRQRDDRARLSEVLRGRAVLRSHEGRLQDAIALAREAVQVADGQRAPVDLRVQVDACYILAALLQTAQQPGALDAAARAHALAQQLFGDRPTALGLTIRSKHAMLRAQGDEVAAAVAEFVEITRLHVEMLGPDHPVVADDLKNLGVLQRRLGDPRGAIASFREELRIRQLTAAEGRSVAVAVARTSLSGALLLGGSYEEALAEVREAMRVYVALFDADHADARAARAAEGLVLARLGRLDEAEAAFAAVLARPHGSPVEAAMVRGRLAILRTAQGRHAEAADLLEQAAAFYTGAPWARARLQAERARALLLSGQPAEALQILQASRAVLARIQVAASPDLAEIDLDVARAQLALGRPVEAAVAAAAAATTWSGFDGRRRDAGTAGLWLARALAASGRHADAAAAARRAEAALAGSSRPADRELLRETRRLLAAASP
ncbi:serine/threonine-protein kinase [uncultured Methylibium sp.]|uniref:serine/threonine-protein kinase n=1 Tax=uncultured Methylibium sp. TaxID=381093 RepID=UPI0025FD96FD|nr:serine/threonine-protein kinase [uncultured Methylibium sp.]